MALLAEDIVDAGRRGVLRARVSDATGVSIDTFYVACFATLGEHGLIADLVEIWADVVDGEEAGSDVGAVL